VQSVAIEQSRTLPVLTGGEVVEAEWQPSGVNGLALAGRPVTTGWRLVHIASGRAVSRSAEDPDPDVLRELAMRIAHLADWTQPKVAASVPGLRKRLEQSISAWRASHPLAGKDPTTPPVSGPETESIRDLEKDVAALVERLRAAEHERVLLRRVVSRLHATLTPHEFTETLASLSHGDRSFVRFLVAEENAGGASAADATAVVQAIRPKPPAAARRRPVAGTQGVSAKRRGPHFGGPDVAAS
jgi:hypothetical protein